VDGNGTNRVQVVVLKPSDSKGQLDVGFITAGSDTRVQVQGRAEGDLLSLRQGRRMPGGGNLNDAVTHSYPYEFDYFTRLKAGETVKIGEGT